MKKSVLALQIANAETGVIQECDAIIANTQSDRIFLDATASGIRVPLVDQFSTALFDSKSWYGPAELGILIVKKPSQWSNPLPHLNAAHPNFDVSLPLLLASAVAAENFSTEVENANTQARKFNQDLRSAFSQVSDADIAGLNIPTGIPLYYKLDANFKPVVKGGEYLDPAAAKDAIAAVANQGKK